MKYKKCRVVAGTIFGKFKKKRLRTGLFKNRFLYTQRLESRITMLLKNYRAAGEPDIIA